jgi:hypothetical protein
MSTKARASLVPHTRAFCLQLHATVIVHHVCGIYWIPSHVKLGVALDACRWQAPDSVAEHTHVVSQTGVSRYFTGN